MSSNSARSHTAGSTASSARDSVQPSRNSRPSPSTEIILPRWQRDQDASICPVCGAWFGLFLRKHHCRKCGKVVCANCSQHKITIPRQFIVHPPPSTSSSPFAAFSGWELPSVVSSGVRHSRNNHGAYHTSNGLTDAETVRVCNPCVPDPNLSPPPQQQLPSPLPSPLFLSNTRSNILQQGTNQQQYWYEHLSASRSPDASNVVENQGDLLTRRSSSHVTTQHHQQYQHQYYRTPQTHPQDHHAAIPSSRVSQFRPEPSVSGTGRGIPNVANDQGTGAATNILRSRRATVASPAGRSHSNRSSNQQTGHRQQHPSRPSGHIQNQHRYHHSLSGATVPPTQRPVLSSVSHQSAYHSPAGSSSLSSSSSPHFRTVSTTTRSTRIGRPQIREEDECPVCGEELPPKEPDGSEDGRRRHVEDCLSSYSSHLSVSVPAASSAILPVHPLESHSIVSGGTGTSEATVGSSSTTSIGPSGSSASPGAALHLANRPRRATGNRMLVYQATEKDCVAAGGEAQECVICFEEFEEGDEMGRLECLCKFHKTCIRQWWDTKGAGSCPTHQLHQ